MTLPETHEFFIEQGKTFKWWFAVQYPDGEIADLPADGFPIARLQIRPLLAGGVYGPAVRWGGPGAPDALTTANGGIVLGRMWDAQETDPGRMQWSGYLWASAAATAQMTPWGDGVCELEIDNGAGDVLSVLRATAVLIPEVAK